MATTSPAAEAGVAVTVVVGEGVRVAAAVGVSVGNRGAGVGVAGKGVGLAAPVGVAVLKRTISRAGVGSSGLSSPEVRPRPQASPAISGRSVKISLNF
jgi:hypothetical protein